MLAAQNRRKEQCKYSNSLKKTRRIFSEEKEKSQKSPEKVGSITNLP
jgi:hypothetical protein